MSSTQEHSQVSQTPTIVGSEDIVAPLSERRSLQRLLGPLNQLAENSRHFISKPPEALLKAGFTTQLPRYVFLGPSGGGDTIRIGIFAAIHGDEPEGAFALARFAQVLEANPEIATGYALFLYPVCNPTGFEDNTRHSRSGKDLNREFWSQSIEPEVGYLQSEILMHTFDGIITLHGDDTSNGLYGFVGGSVLSEGLLEPALEAAEQFLPRNRQGVIDGFEAHQGIINDGYKGMLQYVPEMPKPPFEITFETPQKSPSHLQVDAFVAALETILTEYRSLIAIGQNI